MGGSKVGLALVSEVMCVVRAVTEVIHHGQSEVSRGKVKFEGGKA
jgi:hypothetical protein